MSKISPEIPTLSTESTVCNTTVVLMPLDDTAKLLIPYAEAYNRINNHDLGVVCKAVATELGCSVLDLCAYKVPNSVLIERYGSSVYESVYAVFDSRHVSQHKFLGYYGLLTLHYFNLFHGNDKDE
jgi:hypothetical protein